MPEKEYKPTEKLEVKERHIKDFSGIDDSNLRLGDNSHCKDCIHFREEESFKDLIPVCNAFNDGIPEDIWYNKVDHTKPYPGDKGIRFERILKEESKEKSKK